MNTALARALMMGILLGIPAAASAESISKCDDVLHSPGLLRVANNYQWFTNAVEVFATKAPEYRRLRFVLAMQPLLDNPARAPVLEGYRKSEGELDLNTDAGRLRWIIRRILDQVDPSAKGTPDERINQWMATAMKRNLKTKEQIVALKQRYFGKIKVGQYASAKGVDEAAELLDQFLCDWFPYGKTVAELEGILGLKCTVKDELAEIAMVDPDGETCIVRLVTRNGIIIRVEG